MPVSMSKLTMRNLPANTRTRRGVMPVPIRGAPPVVTLHEPGNSEIRKWPASSVRVVRLLLNREKTSRAFFAGAEHGTPWMQIGVIGERVTVPRIPLGAPAWAEVAPATANARASPVISDRHVATSILRLSVMYAATTRFRHARLCCSESKVIIDPSPAVTENPSDCEDEEER